MIKAVIFDIDGVLLDSLQANYKYYSTVFQNFGRQFVSLEEYRKKYYSMPVKDVLRNLMHLDGQELEDKYQQAKKSLFFNDLLRVPPGEKEIIKELSKKYKLAIVTGRFNVDSTFKVTGIGDYIQVVVKYGDYQKPKPDPEPLKIALEKLNIKANEAVYVGDTKEDLEAAKPLGMKFVTFYAVSQKKFPEADANIGSFPELPGAISQIEKSL